MSTDDGEQNITIIGTREPGKRIASKVCYTVTDRTQINVDGTVYTGGQTVDLADSPLVRAWLNAGWIRPESKSMPKARSAASTPAPRRKA